MNFAPKGQSFKALGPVLGIAILSLTACIAKEKDNLQAYIESVKARPATEITPLPQFKHVESFIYSIKGRRDPFNPDMGMETETAESTSSTTTLKPDFNRRKEELEGYPLDTLRMVGTLAKDQHSWALVKSQDGTIHRVKPGNYLGQNHGQITQVFDEKIDLTEIVSDGRGGYQERPATLVLAEPTGSKK
jgi:type IV pilus assembly protein PilP